MKKQSFGMAGISVCTQWDGNGRFYRLLLVLGGAALTLLPGGSKKLSKTTPALALWVYLPAIPYYLDRVCEKSI